MLRLRLLLRLPVVAGILGCLAVVGWATPAAAHAAVTASSPAQGAHLAKIPHTVTINFDQPVKPDAGGLIVLDSSGQQVQVASGHPSPATLSATLPASLGSGAYVSDYTVTSVDGHVVSGGVVFLVGHVKAGALSALSARPRTSFTNWVDDFGQFLVYVGVLVATGLAFFLAFVLRGGAERRRLRIWTYATAALGVVGMLVTGAAQSALTGGGFAAVAHWSIDTQSFGGKFGEQCGAQLVGLAACLVSLHLVKTVSRQFAAFYGLLVAAGAFVLFGHALVSQERWLSIPADIVHVVFVAMWAGGLVGLITVLRSRTRAARLAGEFPSRGAQDAGVGAGVAGGSSSLSRAVGSGTSTAVLERPAPAAAPGGPSLPPGAPAGGARGGDEGDGDGSLLADTAGVVGRFSTMAGISFAGILVAGTLLAIVCSPLFGHYTTIFEGINKLISYVAPPITIVFLFGVFWKRASGKAAFITLVA
ncbi:MAG TPA: copper resistance protein CopC, partial [Acidimicrobiales bacterium]|nr:copper resistance protein CopC [Acidimicrobiales bacterium]